MRPCGHYEQGKDPAGAEPPLHQDLPAVGAVDAGKVADDRGLSRSVGAHDMARYEKFREVFSLPEKTPIRRMSKGMQKQAAFWLTMLGPTRP